VIVLHGVHWVVGVIGDVVAIIVVVALRQTLVVIFMIGHVHNVPANGVFQDVSRIDFSGEIILL